MLDIKTLQKFDFIAVLTKVVQAQEEESKKLNEKLDAQNMEIEKLKEKLNSL